MDRARWHEIQTQAQLAFGQPVFLLTVIKGGQRLQEGAPRDVCDQGSTCTEVAVKYGALCGPEEQLTNFELQAPGGWRPATR